jgi:hypothetical protein
MYEYFPMFQLVMNMLDASLISKGNLTPWSRALEKLIVAQLKLKLCSILPLDPVLSHLNPVHTLFSSDLF